MNLLVKLPGDAIEHLHTGNLRIIFVFLFVQSKQ